MEPKESRRIKSKPPELASSILSGCLIETIVISGFLCYANSYFVVCRYTRVVVPIFFKLYISDTGFILYSRMVIGYF